MSAYVVFVLRRLLGFAVLLVLASFFVFSLLYLAPGDPIQILLGQNPPSPALIHSLRVEYHLDKPFLEQYLLWLWNAVHLNLGRSVETTLPVRDEITHRLPISLFLGLYAFVLTLLLGIGFGVISALNRRRALDRGVVAVSVVGLSTPGFIAGVVLLYVFGVLLPWFPTFGAGSGFVDRVWHLTLPAAALAISGSALLVKHTRNSMMNVLDQDYVTFARARGLSPRRILFSYCLRNALIPLVTVAAVTFAYLIVGAALVETTFSMSGVGSLLVNAAVMKDVPMVQGVALLVGVIIMTANLVADLLYALIDPRIRARNAV